jgi:hypothetical protein
MPMKHGTSVYYVLQYIQVNKLINCGWGYITLKLCAVNNKEGFTISNWNKSPVNIGQEKLTGSLHISSPPYVEVQIVT